MPSKTTDNERKACDAVTRTLEQRAGTLRADTRAPEDLRHAAPIEYAFELAGRTYAVEHTIVEAFDGQIRSDVDFGRFVEPIAKALDRNMPPPGKFLLCFPIDPSGGLSRKAIAEAQERIVDWVRRSAADLHAECPQPPSKARNPHGHSENRKGVVAGVELTLFRETWEGMPAAAVGRLFVQRFAPPGYESLRIDRLKKAMSDKLPKLGKWKADGARTVLI